MSTQDKTPVGDVIIPLVIAYLIVAAVMLYGELRAAPSDPYAGCEWVHKDRTGKTRSRFNPVTKVTRGEHEVVVTYECMDGRRQAVRWE